MSLPGEFDVMAAGAAEFESKAMRRAALKLKMAVQRRKLHAYRACFMGLDGRLTEHGQIVLADLARIAGLGVARLHRSTEEVQFDEGQRRVVLHLIEMAQPGSKELARLARKLRETDDE